MQLESGSAFWSNIFRMMTTISVTIGWTLFFLALLCGILLDLVGLFGNWIILGAIGILWAATGFVHFGLWSLAGMVALAALGEALEFALAGYGAKRFGGSKGSIWAALIGCLAGSVLGTPFMPVIGTLLGACVGSFAAAALYEYLNQDRQLHAALWTGMGAALGKIGGLFAKLFCGLAILAMAAAAY
jgi:uncharacterized protein YqgC (DUF456 family)